MRLNKIFPIGALLLFSSTAAAEIRIDEARYANGVLTVLGHTSRSFQIIVLDGRTNDVATKVAASSFGFPTGRVFAKLNSPPVETKNLYVSKIAQPIFKRVPHLKLE